MSKVSTTRFPLSQAKVWALEAAEVVAKYSPRVKIAGSIRRMRDDIGDVDLVVLDDSHVNPWQHSAIANALGELGYVQAKDGDKIASFTRDGKASLDVYYATPATWGITLLVRTGSAAHNAMLADRAQKKMLPARRFTLHGIEDTAGHVIAGETEREVFAALGMGYVEPASRHAAEWESFVAPEAT